jgi:hypothetical protein
MSSDEEYADYGQGIDEDCQDTFHRSKEESYFRNIDDGDDDVENNGIDSSINDFHVPKYDKILNKVVKHNNEIVESADSNSNLDDFIELLEQSQADDTIECSVKNSQDVVVEDKEKIVKKSNEDSIDGMLLEKSSGIRIIKSTFSSDMELNMRLCDYGQYFRLTELTMRQEYIKKNQKTLEWYTIGIIGSKTESKCSAKGNNYIIWNFYDLNNLEREQEISLFLFSNAYKNFWKSSEFQVFAIIKPDFLDEQKNSNPPNQNNNNNKYSKTPGGKANTKQTSKQKLSISVRNDIQLIPLGVSKDIVACQSYKRTQIGEHTSEGSQRCKNLVNLRVSKFCVYHCKKLDSTFKMDKKNVNGNKSQFGGNKSQQFGNSGASNYNAKSQFGQKRSADDAGIQVYNPKINLNNLPIKTKYQMDNKLTPDCKKKFVENPASNSSINIESTQKNERQKMKDATLLSLTYDQHDSPLLSNVIFKSKKASDREMLAKLADENIDESELKTIRKAAQSRNFNDEMKQSNKELKNLFSSQLLLPNETNCNKSISAKKLVELKATNKLAGIEKKYDEKKEYNLSTMSSHRDIVKQLKKTTVDDDKIEAQKEVVEVIATEKKVPVPLPSLKVFDFLKQRISDISSDKKKTPIKKTPIEKKPFSDGFDLEIYIGDEKTSKKLMDGSPKILTPKNNSPLVSKKRKLDQTDSPNSGVESEKDKKRKLIDDVINIKSKYSQDANDPEKNAHLKSYLDRLEEKESVENHLSSIKRKEVRVVTCNICKYTSFGQSDLCKSKRHDISRHTALQRYFKCRNCSKRTYTLDKICPVSSCIQCGSDKFDSCGMKNEVIEKTLITNEIVPD